MKARKHLDGSNPHLWQIVAVRDIFWAGLVIILLWFIYSLRAILAPVFTGLFLAYLFDPLLQFARERWHIPRPFTASFILIIAAFIIVGGAVWLTPIVKTQSVSLVQKVPGYFKRLTDKYGIPRGPFLNKFDELVQRLQKNPLSILRFLVGVIGTTTAFIFWLIFVPVYFFFFAWHFQTILNTLKNFLPVNREQRLPHILKSMDKSFGNFFRGRVVICLIISVLFAAGWWFTEVPYWFILGVGTGLLSIIPYLSIIGWFLALLFKYLDAVSGADFAWMAVFLWPTLAYGVVNFIEEWVLTPWIQSESLNLSIVTILIAVLIGGTFGGLIGLLFAIPITACLKILLKEIFLPHLHSWVRSA